MKASFFKRISAFCIDYVILTLVLSFITTGVITNNGSFYEDITEISNEYTDGNINASEYNDKIMKLEYDYQKLNMPVNIVNVVLFIGYFVFFGYLNKGQTLGKKLFKIRVVDKSGDRVKLSSMIIRSLFIYGIVSCMYCIICTLLSLSEVFIFSYKYIVNIESILLFICFLMVMYRKDGRGLHDLVAKTNVIGEVK